MESDATRVCELLVGLPAVIVLGVVDEHDAPIVVYVETRDARPSCVSCSSAGVIKDRSSVELVDLPCFGRPTRLVWRKRRWSCPNSECSTRSWTEDVPAIAARRLVMTDRTGRWVTEQVGRHGRTVNEVALELGCDWHTINDTVIAYGTALIDAPERLGHPTALGLDETLFCRIGPRHRQYWSTSIVDVRAGRLLDVVVGNEALNAFANIDSLTLESFGSVVAGGANPPPNSNCLVQTISHGYNFSDDSTCGFTEATDRQSAGNPMLGPLANNGGTTPTMLPAPGSPLLEFIPVGACQADGAATVTADQRGVTRPQGNGCDIGSVEVVPATSALPVSLTKAFGAASIAKGASTSLTFRLTNPNSETPLSGVIFTDPLPLGLKVASPNGLSNTCGGIVQAVAGSGALSVSGVTLPASSSCTVRVNVRASGSTGLKTNTTTVVTSNEAGLGSAATASVTVTR